MGNVTGLFLQKKGGTRGNKGEKRGEKLGQRESKLSKVRARPPHSLLFFLLLAGKRYTIERSVLPCH